MSRVFWRLTEAKQYTELADSEWLDRTNISRQIHKILPALSKHVYEEYTARLQQRVWATAAPVTLDMDIEAEDIPPSRLGCRLSLVLQPGHCVQQCAFEHEEDLAIGVFVLHLSIIQPCDCRVLEL